jgi:peptide-methionine (R)-S-oxide reductase
LNDADYKKKLTPEQYHVLREKGTEAPFSGKYYKNEETGKYACAACGNVLFSSDSQYETHVPGLEGWPSFGDVIKAGTVELKDDNSMFMHRTEVVCKKCGSHLGHLFDDNTSPTGQHYCINSVALDFKKEDK